MWKQRSWSLMCGFIISAVAAAQVVDESQLGQAVERHLSSDEPVTQWMQDPELFESEGGDKLAVRDGHR